MSDSDQPSSTEVTSAEAVSMLERLPLHSTNLLTLLSPEGIIQYESPAIERLYGYAQDELVGESVADYFHPADRKRVLEAFEAVTIAEDHHTEAVEYRHRMADGSYRWIESVASSNPTPEGNYVVNSRDISTQKQREQELKATRRQVRIERDAKEAVRKLLLASVGDDGIKASTCRLLVAEYDYDAAWITRQYDTDEAVEEPSQVEIVASDGDDNGFRAAIDATELQVDPATQHALDTDTETLFSVDETDQAGDHDVTEPAPEVGETLSACGLSSLQAVPIEFDGVSYGVLTVVRSTPIIEILPELVAEFADAIGFKQRTARQEATLAAHQHAELRCEIAENHFMLPVAASLPEDARLRGHELIKDDGLVTYLLETEAIDAAALADAAVAGDNVSDASPVTDGPAVVRVRVEPPTVGTALAGVGGSVQSLVVADGVLTATAVCSRLTDVGSVADAVSEHWPAATVRETGATTAAVEPPTPFDSLTDKQAAALQAATVAGFFERPQKADAGEIAETLEVSSSTFLHHLRAAERKVFEDAFGGSDD